MRLRAQRTYLLLLILSFVLVDVSESISFAPVIGLLIRGRLIPSFLRNISSTKWISRFWNKLKSLFNRLKIGDVAEGLSDLKNYLDLFGYLNSTLHSNFTNEFTLNLQSAIIEFQKNFNLEVTGQLNRDIYEIISQPRCGVPDIINGTTTMNSGNANTTSFKPWWKTWEKELSYAFHPQNNVTDGVKSLFRDAFNRWSNVTLLNFTETTSFNDSDIKIVFVKFDGKGGMVGSADTNYSMSVGDIYLDSEEQWVLPSEKVSEEDDVDLESVVMHQVGHLLGLGHSSVEEAVMYPIVLQEKKTELTNDDLQRIKQIYGVNSTN
ncbi:PGBD-like superfamily [Sesbania bispinosa]|nr:PGBD-like superfamily [Sesbania bispinosa]